MKPDSPVLQVSVEGIRKEDTGDHYLIPLPATFYLQRADGGPLSGTSYPRIDIGKDGSVHTSESYL